MLFRNSPIACLTPSSVFACVAVQVILHISSHRTYRRVYVEALRNHLPARYSNRRPLSWRIIGQWEAPLPHGSVKLPLQRMIFQLSAHLQRGGVLPVEKPVHNCVLGNGYTVLARFVMETIWSPLALDFRVLCGLQIDGAIIYAM